MHKVCLTVTAILIMAAGAYGTAGGFGIYYFLGIPISEAKITESTLSSLTAEIDMTDGYPLKMSPVNFMIGGIVYFIPSFGVECGFDIHTAYKNKETTIKGTITTAGETEFFELRQREDAITWKMNNFYAGARYTYPTSAGINPVGCGGLIISRSTIEPGS